MSWKTRYTHIYITSIGPQVNWTGPESVTVYTVLWASLTKKEYLSVRHFVGKMTLGWVYTFLSAIFMTPLGAMTGSTGGSAHCHIRTIPYLYIILFCVVTVSYYWFQLICACVRTFVCARTHAGVTINIFAGNPVIYFYYFRSRYVTYSLFVSYESWKNCGWAPYWMIYAIPMQW